VVHPQTEPGSTLPAAPNVPTWVVFKQSLGWTFPICTGTTAVHLSVTQSTNDSEAGSSDDPITTTLTITTTKTTKTNNRISEQFTKKRKVQRRLFASIVLFKTNTKKESYNMIFLPI